MLKMLFVISLILSTFHLLYHFCRIHKNLNKIINIPNLLMIIPTTMVTVGGYFIANGLMYGWAAAIGELTTWWLQPGVGALIYIAVGAGLDAIKFKQKMLPRVMR